MEQTNNIEHGDEISHTLRKRMTIGAFVGLFVGSALVIVDQFTHTIHPESFDIILDICGDLSLGCTGLAIAGILKVTENTDNH